MFVCEKCGKELQQGALICRNCGQRVAVPTQPVKMEKPSKEHKASKKEKVQVEQPMDVSNNDDEITTEISTGGFICMDLLMMIPCVNIIMLIVWICNKKNPTKKHYATAKLILMIVSTVIITILYATVFASMLGSFGAALY